jgi:hypothetical protein
MQPFSRSDAFCILCYRSTVKFVCVQFFKLFVNIISRAGKNFHVKMKGSVIQSFAHGEVMVPGSGWWTRRMAQRTLLVLRSEVQRTKSHLNCGGFLLVVAFTPRGSCALCFIVRDILCCVACLLVIYVNHRSIILTADRIEV